MTAEWRWCVATDPRVVHTLISECDAYVATPLQPPPNRNFETSRRRVRDGSVQLLLVDAQPAATFTLSREPPFSGSLDVFPNARQPYYLSRLAVDPSWLAKGSIVGAQALRRAGELAIAARADALRSEANPTLWRVRGLLAAFGFLEYHAEEGLDGRPRIYLQKDLVR